MSTQKMLLMGVTPREQIYAVLDDATAKNGVVVSEDYVRRVPLWGYLTRQYDVVPIVSVVHNRLWEAAQPVMLTAADRKGVQRFITDVLPAKERPASSGSDDLLFDGPITKTTDFTRFETKAPKRFPRKFEPYDPDAQDGDGDGLVQDGTPWERPGGTRILDRVGREIQRGLNVETRPAGARIVDADGNDVDYTPSWAGGTGDTIANIVEVRPPSILDQPAEGTTPLADHGASTLKERGLRTVRDVTNPNPPEPKGKKPEPEKKPEKPAASTEVDVPKPVDVVEAVLRSPIEKDIRVPTEEEEGRDSVDAHLERLQAFVSRNAQEVKFGSAETVTEARVEEWEEGEWRIRQREYQLPRAPTRLTRDPDTFSLNEEGVKEFTARILAKRLTEKGIRLNGFYETDDWFAGSDKVMTFWDDPDGSPEGKLVLFVGLGNRLSVQPWDADFFKNRSYLRIISPATPQYQELINRSVVDKVIASWAAGSSEGTALIAHGEADNLLKLRQQMVSAVEDYLDDGYKREAVAAVVKTMYEVTQEFLADGPEEYTLYRGMLIIPENGPTDVSLLIRDTIISNFESLLEGQAVPGEGNETIPLKDFLQGPDSTLRLLLDVDAGMNDFPSRPISQDVERLERILSDIHHTLPNDPTMEEYRRYFLKATEGISVTELQIRQAMYAIAQLKANRNRYGNSTQMLLPKDAKVEMNPLNSFSLDLGEAESFSGRLRYEFLNTPLLGSYVVPRERIVGTPGVGFGCLKELEMVIAGGGNISGSHTVRLTVHPWLHMTYATLLYGEDVWGEL